MSASLRRRIERVESTTDKGRPCEECGSSFAEPSADDTYELIFVDEDEDVRPEFCPECGRHLVYILTWGD